jgi:hypothetical protein
MTEDQIEKALARIRRARPKSKDLRGRFAADFYLAEVCRLYCKLRRRDEAWNGFSDYLHDLGVHPSKRTSMIRTILDLTCDTPPKTKSRWCRTVRYTWLCRDDWSDAARFIREKGGPSVCAERWADMQPVASSTWRRTSPSEIEDNL